MRNDSVTGVYGENERLNDGEKIHTHSHHIEKENEWREGETHHTLSQLNTQHTPQLHVQHMS